LAGTPPVFSYRRHHLLLFQVFHQREPPSNDCTDFQASSILIFNYPMINTFLVIFLYQKVGSFLNPIRKVSLLIFEFKFYSIIKLSI
jgi:hypothetical protein